MENNNKLEALKKASEELYQSFVKMNKAWSDFDENLEFDDYPFDINFPELINNVKEWNDEVNSLLHIDNNQMQKTKLSFEEFQNLWIEQETKGLKGKDKSSLVNQLESSFDFEEMFETVKMWSNVELTKRVTDFLNRNNAEIDYKF